MEMVNSMALSMFSTLSFQFIQREKRKSNTIIGFYFVLSIFSIRLLESLDANEDIYRLGQHA